MMESTKWHKSKVHLSVNTHRHTDTHTVRHKSLLNNIFRFLRYQKIPKNLWKTSSKFLTKLNFMLLPYKTV